MDGNESPSPEDVRRKQGIQVAGIGFILVFLSGIVDILTLNMLWPVLTVIGFVFIVYRGMDGEVDLKS